MYKVLLSKKALKDLELLKRSGLSKKAKILIDDLKIDPRKPPREKLIGNLGEFYSKRINIQHRMVYRIDDEELVVLVVSMWTHYGDN